MKNFVENSGNQIETIKPNRNKAIFNRRKIEKDEAQRSGLFAFKKKQCQMNSFVTHKSQ